MTWPPATPGRTRPSRLTIIPGVEQTPNIPWFAVPGEDFPQTLGHFNFWPLDVDPTRRGNGVPWDELREPGQMMDDIDALFAFAGAQGVRQLNHPFADSKLGRDQGFLRAIGYDPRTPIAPGASFAADLLLRTPGATRRPAEPRLGRAGGDERRVARGLAALSGVLVLAAVAGHRARGDRQQRLALAGAGAGRLPAKSGVLRALSVCAAHAVHA